MNDFFKTSSRKTWRRVGLWALRIFRVSFNVALFFAVCGLAAITTLYLYEVHRYGNRLDKPYPKLSQNSYVYAKNGEKIGELAGEKNRDTVGYKDLGKYLPKAAVATEDRRFYEHGGFDLRGIARAAWEDLRSQRVEEGGSTITEQLIKNLFIPRTQRDDLSFWRRLREALLAAAYEQHHTKKQILTTYLNTVYYGRGAYGAQEAAREYFGKDARDLSLSQAAALAGFLHAPSTYPATREGYRRATERRNEVLDLMQKQGMISAAQHRKAEKATLKFVSGQNQENQVYQPFMDKVRREVTDVLGPDALKRGGLRVHTTLSPKMQREAAASAREVLYKPSDPSASVVTIQPQTGAIRSLVGQDGDFNLALDARRQPGSAFKPFVLAAALKQGISPRTVYDSHNLDVSFDGKNYSVKNYGLVQRGDITVEQAMAQSDNTVFMQLAADVGLQNVVKMAHDLGITSPLDPYPSTAIGGLRVGVSPLDMASAYATIAARGIYRKPYAVEKISRVSFGHRNRLYDHQISGDRILSSNEAAAETQVLRQVVKSGTVSEFHNLDSEIGRPSAGKTGTTDDFTDAWYVGYTPQLSTAVWVGYPQGRNTMVGVHGLSQVNGENFPLDIWSRYMAQATAGQPVLDFPQADMSKFKIKTSGYAVKPQPPQPPKLASTPAPLQAVNGLAQRIKNTVAQAMKEAFGGQP